MRYALRGGLVVALPVAALDTPPLGAINGSATGADSSSVVARYRS
jgi:hypothetical protein